MARSHMLRNRLQVGFCMLYYEEPGVPVNDFKIEAFHGKICPQVKVTSLVQGRVMLRTIRHQKRARNNQSTIPNLYSIQKFGKNCM